MLKFILFLGEIDLNTNLIKITSSKYLETAKIAKFTYAKSDCSAIYCLKRQTEAMNAKKRGINKNVSKEFLVTL
jgi:hypothetical protein